MTEQNLESIQRKIAGLLAKAERAGSPEEAEAFAAKAEQMMVKYAIDAAMLGATTSSDTVIVRAVDIKGTYALQATGGLNGLSQSLGTTRYWISGKASGTHTGHLAGFTTDVDMVIMLWNSLSIQAATAMASWAKDGGIQKSMTAFEKFNERRTFLTGFWGRACARAASAHATAVKEAEVEYSGGAALALVDRASQVEAVVPQGMRTQKSRTKSGSMNAAMAGAAAAERADLGQKRMAGNRSAISR